MLVIRQVWERECHHIEVGNPSMHLKPIMYVFYKLNKDQRNRSLDYDSHTRVPFFHVLPIKY